MHRFVYYHLLRRETWALRIAFFQQVAAFLLLRNFYVPVAIFRLRFLLDYVSSCLSVSRQLMLIFLAKEARSVHPNETKTIFTLKLKTLFKFQFYDKLFIIEVTRVSGTHGGRFRRSRANTGHFAHYISIQFMGKISINFWIVLIYDCDAL